MSILPSLTFFHCDFIACSTSATSSEADFAGLLNDHDRSITALQAARRANPRDPFIASRLSSLLVSRGDSVSAKKFLEEALEGSPGDKRLNYQYAEVLRTTGTDLKTLVYFYRRSFSKWDQNYDSQFWYARYGYESEDAADNDDAREVFRHLRDVPMSHDERIRIRDMIGGLKAPTDYEGSITRVEATHGFVTVDGRGDSLFFHEDDCSEDAWKALRSRQRVSFNIAFSLRGPKAVSVRLGAKIKNGASAGS